MLKHYESVVDSYKVWHPNLYDQTVECRTSGRDSIVARLRDGTRVEYNARTNAVRFVTKFYEQDLDHPVDEESWRKEFGNKLRSVIGDRGLTQERLCDLTGISRQMLTRYVRGTSTPSAYILNRLSEVLECDIRDLCKFNYLEE